MRSILLWTLASIPSILALKVSTTARCGAEVGLTCRGSNFGECCSSHGYCGSTPAYCQTGCQSGFGKCGTTSSPNKPVAKVSKDGRCGGYSGYTCQGSTFGNCCNKNGYCGKTSDYCGTGCDSKFGTCGVKPSSSKPCSSSKAKPTSTRAPSASSYATPKVSNDAHCGAGNGKMTCMGSKWGNCCSKNGYW
ncbi:hypothetical protein GRF29_44g732429 [Pseudopithomyces chartarum]|uniref:Chitin-binding type-1 domain-containing protein n=1 Tax=Pseudopithomyces chartarum TaxID=1892770 RepID=A0AAN6LZ54_9PLEO|nr:hypothetical protein GRF29_44g732429 [Pseudopithomyces chartarum]